MKGWRVEEGVEDGGAGKTRAPGVAVNWHSAASSISAALSQNKDRLRPDALYFTSTISHLCCRSQGSFSGRVCAESKRSDKLIQIFFNISYNDEKL